jgi:hypothetical protein
MSDDPFDTAGRISFMGVTAGLCQPWQVYGVSWSRRWNAF